MPCDVPYRDKFVHQDELDLCLFIALMSRIIDRDHSEASWYENARKRWHYEIEHSGNNLLDLRMDDLITGPGDLHRMKELLSRLQDEIKSYGEFIPHKEASAMVPATMWYRRDQSVERLCAEVEKIVAVLPESWTPR